MIIKSRAYYNEIDGHAAQWGAAMTGAFMTKPQAEALRWLLARSGDGCFDNDGVLLAAGELAPFMRSTWNALRDLGLVEFYNPAGKGRGRCRVVRGVRT